MVHHNHSHPRRPGAPTGRKPPNPGLSRSAALKRKRLVRLILILSGLVGASLLSATVGALLAFSLSSTPLLQHDLSPEEAAIFAAEGDLVNDGMPLTFPRLTRPVNILVLGTKVLSTDLDNPPPESQGLGYHALVNSFDGLTDTMVLLRFDPFTEQLTALSVPRDTRAYVQGYGLTKINEANVYGGPALAAQSVSELLNGVGIDRYVRINVQGVEKLIDALGGVKIYVPQDMYYQDDSQHLYINLKQGEQHLNGSQALQFLRFRYDNFGDIGRIQRQQMLMRAFTEQTLTPRTVGRLPRVLGVIKENLDTNLSMDELSALVGFARRTDRSNMQMLMLPGDFSEPGAYDASYWLPNYPAIDAMAYQYFEVGSGDSQGDLATSGVRIAVQDSTGRPQATNTLVDTLAAAGYSNVYVDVDWPESLATTQIIAQGGDRQQAELIQQSLGFGEVWVESTGDLTSDITIRLGQDWIHNQQ